MITFLISVILAPWITLGILVCKFGVWLIEDPMDDTDMFIGVMAWPITVILIIYRFFRNPEPAKKLKRFIRKLINGKLYQEPTA